MTTDFVQPAPRAELLWLAADLDGTLAEPVWTAANPTSEIGDPIWANVEKLRAAVAVGFKPVIHTARPSTDYEAIEAWLRHHKIPFSRIQTGKILAAAYIDDRAVRADAASWIPGENPYPPGTFQFNIEFETEVPAERRLYDLLLDRMGFVDGAETSADGSYENDLAHERATAALRVLEALRASCVPDRLVDQWLTPEVPL